MKKNCASSWLFTKVKFVYLTQQSTPFDVSCLERQVLPKLCGFKLRLDDRKCITFVCVFINPVTCNAFELFLKVTNSHILISPVYHPSRS